MVWLVLLGALAWVLFAFANGGEASSYISYTYLSAGVQDSTVVITGKPAGSLSVYAVTADVAITWNNSGGDAGTVPGGTTMTWTGIECYQFRITSAASTEVYAYTW